MPYEEIDITTVNIEPCINTFMPTVAIIQNLESQTSFKQAREIHFTQFTP